MIRSTRAVLAVGLALFGAGCLVGPLLAQQRQDEAVRKAAANKGAQAPPPPLVPPVIGTVDIEVVFKNYDKFKVQGEEFSAAALAKHKELLQLNTQYKEEAEKLQKMVPTSVDAKKIENALTQLKAQIEAGREQAQRDFGLRETEMVVATYKEVAEMVAKVAQYRGITYVMKVSSKPIAATNPDSAMAEMSKAVVYADPRNDITRDVIHNLNTWYKAAGGVAPKGNANPAGGGEAGAGGANGANGGTPNAPAGRAQPK